MTVSAIVVVCVVLPPVPVTVTVTGPPTVAVLEAVSVSMLLVPVVLVVVGLKLAVTPLGKPLAVKVIALANPPIRVMVIVLVPLAPRTTDKLVGLAARLKSGVAVVATVNVMVAV